ncbi:MAG: tRNA (guanosine(46)-N7)-methyltransferase TrmB [Campylobacterota bacterium]|nr:tRNA (guanosine(46)-N7)-methyltransferase TrmB [Campylobacterota bacterium]
MPHILFESHEDIDLDNKCDNVNTSFNFIAKGEHDQKIGASIDGREFLLTKVNKKGDTLLKLDNGTRLTPVSIMKDALNDYAAVSEAQVLFSNTNTIYKNKVKPEETYLKDIEYFTNEFKTDKEIWIEVGFGSGVHLLHQASENPDKLIIGLEIHTPSIEQVLKQAKLQGITNILVINYDARLFLEFLESNSVGRIFVHFPVPWDKKPHRRVMSIPFIDESLRVLKPKGTLELRTDSPNYFEYSSGLLDHFKEYPSTIEKDRDLAVVSKYEARWKRQEKNIWDVTIESTEVSPAKVIEGDFEFPNKIDIDSLQDKLPKKAIIKEDYLVHFEAFYDIDFGDTKGLMIRLTMGNFNKPVTKNILIKDSIARYYQSNPIKTISNLDAHKVIVENLK